MITARAVSAVFVVSIGVTLLFLLLLPAGYKVNENSDYLDHYEPVARSILDGQGITSDDRFATRSPPGYSLLLAAQFGLAHRLALSERAVDTAFAVTCVGLTAVLVFLLARSVWGLWPALFAAAAWMTYPFLLWLTKQPNGELPFLVVLYSGFTVCWYAVLGKRRAWLWCFAGGLLLGLAMLIHPIAIFMGLIMSVVVALAPAGWPARARITCAALVLLGNLVAVLPWEVFAYQKIGRVIPLSTGGGSAMRDGLTFAVDLRGFRLPGRVPPDVLRLMTDLYARRDETESLRGIVTVMAEEAQKRPLTVMKLLGLKIVRSWYGTDSRRYEFQVMLLQIPYLALVLWGTWQAWTSGGIARKLAVTIWVVALYYWAMNIMVVSMLRYMMPAIGLLLVILAASFAGVTGQRRQLTRRAGPTGSSLPKGAAG